MEQEEIIRRLSTGEGFGNVRPERMDTHISVIFLVGDHAYKLKRALKTSYLDYSTLDDRRRYCLAELAVNRRTAPQIYLDVVPVRQAADGALVIGEGTGQPIEWLVHMRRFSQEALLDRMAEDGRLTAPVLTDLADAIAVFHREAERIVDGAASRRIAFVIDENAEEMRSRGAELLDRAMVDAFERRCRAAFDSECGRIDRRGGAGFVRHCHGDLHLRNICLIDGKPTLFDAIEFSDAISHIDVLYDLAFLLMDLEHRGLRAEGNLLFNRYLYRTRDIDDLAVLPLFLALRAGIRAHVSAMAAAAAAGAQRERSGRDAGAYLALGLRLLEPSPPILIAIGGLSGTGKSTVARQIAPHMGVAPGALILSSDLIRKRLMGREPLARLGQEAYCREVDEAVYGEMMDAAARALGSGRAVILDATFQDPAWRRDAEALGRAAGARFEGVWLQAAPARLDERLRTRTGDPSDATPSVLARQLKRDTGEVTWRRIDADRPAEAVSRAVRATILKQPAGEEADNDPEVHTGAHGCDRPLQGAPRARL